MLTSEKSKKTREKSFMERIIFETNIEYKPVGKSVLSGICSDLSVGGLYLRTKFPFNIDEIIKISFFIQNLESEISILCKARVAWTNIDTNRCKPVYPSGVGLQFIDISSENFSELSKFIDAYDDNKKMNVLCAWCGSYLGRRKGPFGTTSHGICDQCREKLEPEI